MKYYKYIDLPNVKAIQARTLEFIQKHGFMDKRGWHYLPLQQFTYFCPEVNLALGKYKLWAKETIAIIVSNLNHSKIHIDYVDPMLPECRINIPILNCAGSTTEYYSGGEFIKTVRERLPDDPYLNFREDDASIIKVDEFELIRPAVIRVKEPHRVVPNFEAVPRISLSLRCNIDPVFLLED